MRNLLFLMLLTSCCEGLAQDASKRMNPADWLELPEVEMPFAWSRLKAGGYSSRLSIDGWVLFAPSGKERLWWVRNGDLRVVTDSLGVNQSVSHNLGFNLGAYHFSHQKKRYALGGAGFWRSHATLIEFIEKTGEWELSTMEKGPNHVRRIGAWLDLENGSVTSIDWAKSDSVHCDVWQLDLSQLKWSLAGRLNPALHLYTRGLDGVVEWIELVDFIVMAGQNQTLIVRKSDLNSLVVSAWNPRDFHTAITQEEGDMAVLQHARGNVLEVWKYHLGSTESLTLRWNVDSVWSTLSGEASFEPFVVPCDTIGEDRKTDRADAMEGEVRWPFQMAIFFGTVSLLIFVFLFRKRARVVEKGGNLREVSIIADPKKFGDDMLSEMIERLEGLKEQTVDTDRINAIFDFGEELSEESKRVKRAHLIRNINLEYRRKYGADLIVREKSKQDRRRTHYVIRSLSNNV